MFSKYSLSDLESFVADAEDPVQFQQAYFQVIAPEEDDGMKPYRPYKYQQEIAKDNNDLVAIVKSRQTGISTSTVLDMIHRGLNKDNHTCLFVSLRQDQANELIFKARAMIESMPKAWRIPLPIKQAAKLQFNNDSRLIAVSAHESATRSYAGDLVLDEFAHVPNDVEILMAAMATTVRKGLRIRMLSTPYGQQGMFAKIVLLKQRQLAGQSITPKEEELVTPWTLHQIHWTECPDLIEERIKARCPSEDIFLQEYCMVFLDEATTMLTWRMLMEATDINMKQYTLSSCPQNPNSSIFIGVDPGEKVNESGVVVVENIDDKWYLRHVFAKKMGKDALVNYVKMWYNAAKPTKIYIDESGMGAGYRSDLIRDLGASVVTPIWLSSQMKEKLVYHMIGLFEAGKIILPDNEYLKQQLHALERTQTELQGISRFSGKVRAEAHQDDLIWATVLAVAHNYFNVQSLQTDVIKMKHPFKKKYRRGRTYGQSETYPFV